MNAFNALFDAIKAELGISHYSDIIIGISHLITLLGEDYIKDGNAKDAALDAISQILQQHKSNQAK